MVLWHPSSPTREAEATAPVDGKNKIAHLFTDRALCTGANALINGSLLSPPSKLLYYVPFSSSKATEWSRSDT